MGGAAGLSSDGLTLALLVGSLTLIVAIAAVRLSVKTGFPSLLLYLGLGMVLGQDLIGIPFESPTLAQSLGYAALVIILIEGGLTTDWAAIRPSVGPAVALSTVGVVVSVVVVAIGTRVLLDLPWTTAWLLGAITASTDAAAVFSVLRRVPLPRRVSGVLEAESGFNDAPVVILVTVFATRAADPVHALGWVEVGALAVFELAGGAIIGLAIGWLGARFLSRVRTGTSGLFAIAVITLGVLAYAAAAAVHTSGFIACYLAALVLGNAELPHQSALNAFGESLGWLAQIGLFVMLGLLSTPHDLGRHIVPAIAVGLVLLLVARPLSVLICLVPFRVPLREQVFMSWAGLRGAVPIVLATVPMAYQSLHVEWIFDLILLLVIIFTLVQAPILPFLAKWLGIAEQHLTLDVAVDTTALDELDAYLLEVTIGEHSHLSGVEVGELRLPPGANVTLVVRDGHGFVPTERTILHRDDRFLIVTTAELRLAVADRIEAVSRDGRLAGWSGGHRRAPHGELPGRPRTGRPEPVPEMDPESAPNRQSRWRRRSGRPVDGVPSGPPGTPSDGEVP